MLWELYSDVLFVFESNSVIPLILLVGLFCIRYPEMMLEGDMRDMIFQWLTKDCAATKKIEVHMHYIQ